MVRMIACWASSTWVRRTGAEQLDLLEQVLGGALGQVRGDLVADRLADALEGERELGGVDLAQHQLHRAVVEAGRCPRT